MARWSPRRAIWSTLIAAVMLLPNLAWAQQTGEEEYLYGFHLNASLGFAIPNTDEYSNSFYYKLGAGYSVNDMLVLELSGGRFSSDVNNDMEFPPSNSLADGELTVIPVVLTAQFRTQVPQLFGTIYALAGAGYYLIDYSWNGGSKEYFSEVEALYGPARQEVSNSFGFNVGAGYDYPVSASIVLNVEGQYLFLSPEVEGNWRDLLTGVPYRFVDDLDLNTWLFTAGIKYLF